MTNEELHKKLKKIRHGWTLGRFLREFDLDYWQMQSALGYAIPSRVEERWLHEMGTGNPYKCGMCSARQKFHGLHVAMDIRHFRETLSGTALEDFERRLAGALEAK